jgi:hypothetical protein
VEVTFWVEGPMGTDRDALFGVTSIMSPSDRASFTGDSPLDKNIENARSIQLFQLIPNLYGSLSTLLGITTV